MRYDQSTTTDGRAATPMEFDVTVETPAGNRNKYVMDERRGRIRLDRMLFTAMRYPADYGFIEDTLGRDDEPLDALMLLAEPTFPGCVVSGRAVGLFVMRDEKGPDAKVLCVPAHDPRVAAMRDIGDVREYDLMEIGHFFEVYKQLEPGKCVEGSHWAGRVAAEVEIVAARERAHRERARKGQRH